MYLNHFFKLKVEEFFNLKVEENVCSEAEILALEILEILDIKRVKEGTNSPGEFKYAIF